MQSPVWVLNSLLTAIFSAILIFSILKEIQIPKREKLEPEITAETPKKYISKIDCTRIYTEDLFNTLIKPIVEKEEVQPETPALPAPPRPKIYKEEEEFKPQFLEPLAIKLKGIFISPDNTVAQAIIANTKTGEEKLYSQGSKIEDAYILRIFANKVILIRSNGQQETIFLNELEAQNEIKSIAASSWANIIQTISPSEYVVDPEEFSKEVQNLAMFIDALDLTTVFKKGKSLGVRIGRLPIQSVGDSLGFIQGDIILRINGTPVTDTQNRIEIYNQIKNLNLSEKIYVEIERDGKIIEHTYHLQKVKKAEVSFDFIKTVNSTPAVDNAKIAAQASKLAYEKVVNDIQKKDKVAMLNWNKQNRGSKGALFKNLN